MKKEKICGIYKIENILNGNIYIGQSINIKNRFKSHKSNLRLNKHCNTHLQCAWNKYGEDNFEFSILELCNRSELNEKEKKYICQYNSFKLGYNRDLGGGVGRFSNETIEKIRKANSNPSKETREKMRNSQKKRPVLQIDLKGNIIREWSGAREASKELNIKQDCIFECLHNKRKTYKSFIWIFKSEVDSFNLMNYINQNTQARQVVQLSLDYTFIREWRSGNQIQVELGYCCNNILKACKSETKYAVGYLWLYKEDYKEHGLEGIYPIKVK